MNIDEAVATANRGEYVNMYLPDLVKQAAKACEICFGDGWVCEEHPMRSWETGASADCQCGAPGMPCACTGLT